MSRSTFADKSIKPDDDSLYEILGTAANAWKQLLRYLEEKYGPVTEEWKFYSRQSGWILKVLRKKRNLFFFTPLKGHFRLSFIFGDKAISVIEKSDLPKSIITALVQAKKYVEGRAVQIDVKIPQDLVNVKKLVEAKIGN